MVPTNVCTLQRLPVRHPVQEHRRRLVIRDLPTSTVVCGDEIIAQYVCGDLNVVLTDYDYYDGTQHWCYLTTAAGSVIDRVTLPDTFGALQQPTVESPTQISFGCYGTYDRWRLTVTAPGYWSFRTTDLTCRGVRYLLAKRYLTLVRTRGPAWSAPMA
jgi:hypothetical protein